METLYKEITAAGIETASHESDLYFPDTEAARDILNRYDIQKNNATRFTSNIDGKRWVDVPFAFDPFWEAKP